MGKSEQKNSADISQIEPNAAGIDIGAEAHWVSVPEERDKRPVRSFGCFTKDLRALSEWLKGCGITTVAMESTGVYWIPVFQILESAGFEVRLVNAHFVKTVPGRKSDVLDCQWLRQLHSYGLLSGSFRPDEQVCQLRSYVRQRDTLIKSASRHIQRMQKALTQMNVQLHSVMSDITGVTGMAIIRAIVSGERDPKKLAALRDWRMKSTQADIAAALEGDYRPEHLFVLEQELQLYEMYQLQLKRCDQQIEQCLETFEDKTSGGLPGAEAKPPKPRGNEPAFDLRTHLHRISGVDFTAIDGFGVLTVQTILSEVGLDSSRFPSARHFVSWLGLCPGSRISGGKNLSSKTRRVVNRAATAFRLAALAVSKSHSALGAFFRRIRGRLGAPKAITATANKMARLFYRLWSTGEAYDDPGADYYEQRHQQRVLNSLKKRASRLGFDLVPVPDSGVVS